MKQTITFLFLFLALACAGQEYSIESVTDSTVALKETTIGADSLENVTYLTDAIDSASMVERLFGFIRAKRTGEARSIRKAKEFKAEGNALNAISNAFSDSLYFDWTKANYSSWFTQTGTLPNYRIRVGATLYWAKAFISPAGVLVMEVTNSNGTPLSQRDLKRLLILSPESFRLLALTIIGENVDFVLIREDSGQKKWEGDKQDGTTIRITQFLDR